MNHTSRNPNPKPEMNGMIKKALEPEEFRRQAHLVIEFLIDYYQNVENYPVRSPVEPGYLKKRAPDSAPSDPEPIENILRDVKSDIIPGLTHWQSPNFFAYFPCNVSTAGILGDLLCAGFNVPGFNWISSPAATELESTVVDWIGKMLQLPGEFLFSGGGGGVIQGTTCEAILSVVVAARDQMLKKIGGDKIGKLVVYGSDQTHSAFEKAARIAGIMKENIRAIVTAKSHAFAMTAEALRQAIESDIELGLVPLFLCASVGTTASTAVDPLGLLGAVAKEYGVWVHVDGAYAVSACICPEFRRFIDGVENTDSFSFNPHKWMFMGLDCCCVWLKNPAAVTAALSSEPEFLKNKASQSNEVVDYKDWQITLSRRFRSIKLWMVLRSFGVENLRKLIRNHVRMAGDFETLVKTDKRFEVVVPRNFSTVCFRISRLHLGEAVNDVNALLLESVNESGKVFMTHAVIGGAYVIRVAVGASQTEDRHIELAWKVVQEHADSMLRKMA